MRPFPSISRQATCELCGQRQFLRIADRDRRGAPLHTAICRRCGLIVHEQLPTDADLAEFYRRRYRRAYHGEETPSQHRVLRAWRRGQHLLQQLRSYVPPERRVLEIGAGLGCTVKAFQLAGFRATGIEPGASFQEYSRHTLQSPVRHAALEDLKERSAYDMVLLVHVIEHLNRPLRSLQQIRRLLAPSGRLYVECPNVAGPHAAPGKQFHYAHVYNFTPDTLSLLAARAGFRLVACWTANCDATIQMLFERHAPQSLPIPADAGQRTLAAVARHNRWTYHLRRRYLRERLARAASLYSDYAFAGWRLRSIHQQCQTTTPAAQFATESAYVPPAA